MNAGRVRRIGHPGGFVNEVLVRMRAFLFHPNAHMKQAMAVPAHRRPRGPSIPASVQVDAGRMRVGKEEVHLLPFERRARFLKARRLTLDFCDPFADFQEAKRVGKKEVHLLLFEGRARFLEARHLTLDFCDSFPDFREAMRVGKRDFHLLTFGDRARFPKVRHLALDFCDHFPDFLDAKLMQALGDARIYASDYELSEVREEQLDNAKKAKKYLEQARASILKASETNIFGAVDVAQLSAQIDQIIGDLK